MKKNPEKSLITDEYLFDQIQTAIFCTDADLIIKKTNTATEVLFLTGKTNLLDKPLNQFMQTDNNLLDCIKKSKDNRQAFSLIDTSLTILSDNIINQKQRIKLVDLYVSPVVQESEKKATHVFFIFEIRLKGQQAEIIKQENQRYQHEVTRKLIRNIAHEVKNPLASIRGAAQLIKMTVEHSDLPPKTIEELNEYSSVMIKESDRVKNLADAMLGSNKLMKKQLTNIHEPLEHVITLVKSQFKNIKLVRDYDLSIPEITLDKDRMIQVFLNITLNAAQILTETAIANANIVFKSRIAFHKVISGKSYKHTLVISVIDNGIGIPKSVQKTLFYPMVSNRKGGTGLGLSIAQDIVRHHDGEIACHSEKGNTQFDIFIPFTNQI